MSTIQKIWQDGYPVIILAFLKLLVHLLFNTQYSFHRDEFLYLDEANHLSLGYMEAPPVIAWLGAIAQFLGNSY